MKNEKIREIKIEKGKVEFYKNKNIEFSVINVKRTKVHRGNKKTKIEYCSLISHICIKEYQKRIEKNNIYKKQEKVKIAIDTLFSAFNNKMIIPANIFTVNALMLSQNEHIEAITFRKIVKEQELNGKFVNGVKCYYPAKIKA